MSINLLNQKNMKNMRTFLVMLAFLGLSINGVYATTYIITKSGSNFSVTISGVGSLGSPNATLQNKINDIRTNASGAPCTIQFGSGAEIDLGGGSTTLITFDGTWGEITLTGQATSSNINTGGCIRLEDGVSVNSKATLTLETTGVNGRMICNYSTGTLTVSEGTIWARNEGGAIVNYSTGTVNITGGWVEANTGIAIANLSTGTVNISGGWVVANSSNAVHNEAGKITISDTATVRSANADAGYGTIFLCNNGEATDCRLEITGGTVKNTADNGRAVRNNSKGAIDISGGKVEATGKSGCAVYNYSTGTVNISGGTVQTTGNNNGSYAVLNSSTGAVNISGGTVQAIGNYGNAVYNNFEGKITVSGTALVTSSNIVSPGIIGCGTIYMRQGTDTDWRLKITGGTVENTASNANGITVYNYSPGAIDVSGGKVLAKEGYAIYLSNGTATLSNGVVFAYGENHTDVIYNGDYGMLSGNAVVISWDAAAGTTTYKAGTNDDIAQYPATATAVWAKQSGNDGISYTNSTNTGFITIEGVMVGTTGIETITNGELQIYPNPTSDVLYFSLEAAFEITDLQGRVLLKSGKAVQSVNINNLPEGTYFVTLIAKTGKTVKKIIKE